MSCVFLVFYFAVFVKNLQWLWDNIALMQHLSNLCEYTECLYILRYIVYLPVVNLLLGEKLEYRKGYLDRATHRSGTKI